MSILINPFAFGGGSWDLSANVVAQYKLNDDLATTAVINSIGTNGTLAGGDNTEDISVTGKINDAFDFNGTDDCVNCNQDFDSIFQTSFSIEVWIQPDDGHPVVGGEIFGSNLLTTDSVDAVLQTSGKVRIQYGSDSNDASAMTNTPVFPDGATSWTHIIFTVSEGNGIKIYVDSLDQTLDGTMDGDMAGVTMANYESGVNFYIGALNSSDSGANGFFAGLIDNVRIFNKELSSTEVGYLYNSGTGTEANSG